MATVKQINLKITRAQDKIKKLTEQTKDEKAKLAAAKVELKAAKEAEKVNKAKKKK